MNMKYTKQINTFMAFALILGAVTFFAPQARAEGSIMSSGQNAYDSRIMSTGSTGAIIPDLYAPRPQNPVIVYQPAPTVAPTVVYQPAPTTVVYTQPATTQSTTNNNVLGTTIHSPKVNGIKTTTNTVATTASSNVPGICPSDTVNYTLNYANTTTGTITNAIMIVSMPAEIDYVSSTAQANYNNRNRTVTIFIGTLEKGQSGIVYLQGTANRATSGTSTISTRVDFTFNKADGTNATTTNFVIHSGTNCGNALAGSAIGAGFLPTSFGGWLLLAIILCAVIFIVQKFFGKKEGHAHGGTMEHHAH